MFSRRVAGLSRRARTSVLSWMGRWSLPIVHRVVHHVFCELGRLCPPILTALPWGGLLVDSYSLIILAFLSWNISLRCARYRTAKTGHARCTAEHFAKLYAAPTVRQSLLVAEYELLFREQRALDRTHRGNRLARMQSARTHAIEMDVKRESEGSKWPFTQGNSTVPTSRVALE